MRSKKYLALLVSIALVIGLGVASIAGADTTGTGAVSFTVLTTQAITAFPLALGSVPPGTTSWTGGSGKQPVEVDSNVGWTVTAKATADNFVDSGVTLLIGNLKMAPTGGTLVSMPGPSGTAITIASGSSGENIQPYVDTSLTVPWTGNYGGKTLSATITYTVTTP